MNLRVRPSTRDEAMRHVRAWHRHHRRPVGMRFALAVVDGETVHGVCIVGRPVARRLDDGTTAEVVRVATDGTRNACSMLLGAAARAWRAMGGSRIITYTLPSEGGASLRGAGWRCVGTAGGGLWDRVARPRDHDVAPSCVKWRWERALR